MSGELLRKYIDIVNESQQLDEGMLDSVAKAAKAAVEKMSPGLIKKISDFVEKTLGKSVEQLSMADVNMANAKKLVSANGTVGEADINPQYTIRGPDGDRETAVVPGSLGKNQAEYAKIGGILGAVAGAIAPMWAGGSWASNTGSAMAIAAAAGAILIAIIASRLASPDSAETGRVKSDPNSPDVAFDPARRDPRLGPADSDTAKLPKPQRTGFL